MIITTLLLALNIGIITTILPIFFNVPKYIYANIAAPLIVALGCGPFAGFIYILLYSLIIKKNIIGSTIFIYVLLFQIIEVLFVGSVYNFKPHHGAIQTSEKSNFMHIKKYVFTVFALVFFIKPLSFILFYIFENKELLEPSFLLYFRESLRRYFHISILDSILIYASSLGFAEMSISALKLLINKTKKGVLK